MQKNNLYKFIYNFFAHGQERTLNLKKNVFGTSSIRAFNIFLSFVSVPITIGYLNQTYYGVWVTLLSIINWLYVFDIGLGNGLKNKLAQALALKNYELSKKYVSTSYAILGLLFTAFFVVFFVCNFYINWSIVLNIDLPTAELRLLTNYIILFFSIQFVLRLINTVLIAHQKNYISDIINTIPSIFLLVYVLILAKVLPGSLFWLAFGYNLIFVFVLLGFNIYYFLGKFRHIAPAFKCIDFSIASDLLTLGIKFFVLQIAALVLFSTGNILIAQYFGPKEVTNYNLAYKYFNILGVFYGVVMDPLWISITDAYSVKDFDWIKRIMKKISYISFALTISLLGMFALSDVFFRFWVGSEIHISLSLKISLCIYFGLYILGTHFIMFINGVGKVYLILIVTITTMILFFPVSIALIKYSNLGVASIVMCSFLMNLPTVILTSIQYKKIINGTATGIWNK